MILAVLSRFNYGTEGTLGWLNTPVGSAFTMEDRWREKKVRGETCIPEGTYRVELRKVGGFHARYGRKFGDWHRGMLWLRDVPGFEYILIHIGNFKADTDGCILVGEAASQNDTAAGHVLRSTDAYRRIYPGLAAALEAGEELLLVVRDVDPDDLPREALEELRGGS